MSSAAIKSVSASIVKTNISVCETPLFVCFLYLSVFFFIFNFLKGVWLVNGWIRVWERGVNGENDLRLYPFVLTSPDFRDS